VNILFLVWSVVFLLEGSICYKFMIESAFLSESSINYIRGR